MKINSISGVSFLVGDIATTAEFYEALGFRLGKREPGRVTCYVNWFWITFVTKDAANAAFEKDAARSNKGSGVLLHLKVDDIDECHTAVIGQGMTPTSEPRKTPSGTSEFVLKDPDGYKLVFFTKK